MIETRRALDVVSMCVIHVDVKFCCFVLCFCFEVVSPETARNVIDVFFVFVLITYLTNTSSSFKSEAFTIVFTISKCSGPGIPSSKSSFNQIDFEKTLSLDIIKDIYKNY